MCQKKILMINISRSPIAMILSKFEDYEKRGSEYVCSKLIIKFIRDSDVCQELIDWADIICSKPYGLVYHRLKNKDKILSTTPEETVKKVLYGEETLYIVHNYGSEVRIEKKIICKNELDKYYPGFVFLKEEEAIQKAKELIKDKIKELNSTLKTFEKQLKKIEKEKTLL